MIHAYDKNSNDDAGLNCFDRPY